MYTAFVMVVVDGFGAFAPLLEVFSGAGAAESGTRIIAFLAFDGCGARLLLLAAKGGALSEEPSTSSELSADTDPDEACFPASATCSFGKLSAVFDRALGLRIATEAVISGAGAGLVARSEGDRRTNFCADGT